MWCVNDTLETNWKLQICSNQYQKRTHTHTYKAKQSDEIKWANEEIKGSQKKNNSNDNEKKNLTIAFHCVCVCVRVSGKLILQDPFFSLDHSLDALAIVIIIWI